MKVSHVEKLEDFTYVSGFLNILLGENTQKNSIKLYVYLPHDSNDRELSRLLFFLLDGI